MKYFTILRTKEESEKFIEALKPPYLFIADFSMSTAVCFRIFTIKIFHQYRPLFYFQFSKYDTDIYLFFDFIHITFNYSLR